MSILFAGFSLYTASTMMIVMVDVIGSIIIMIFHIHVAITL